MRLKPIILYSIGILLLLFGYRDLWDELQEQKQQKEKQEEELAKANERLKTPLTFDVQKLKYDSLNNKWSNPHYYFQLVNLSYINFENASIGKNKRTTIETNDDEDASDSQ